MINNNNYTSGIDAAAADTTSNDLAIGVVIVYLAVAVWFGLMVQDYRNKKYWTTLIYGLTLAICLNVRYLLHGHGPGIALFIGIYDVTDNIGLMLDSDIIQPPSALSSCLDNNNGTGSSPQYLPGNNNDCSVWTSNRYRYHPTWGVAFYDRFASDPPKFRSLLLNIHIIFNTISFILIHIQIALMMMTTTTKTTTRSDDLVVIQRKRYIHKWLGYLTMTTLFVGVGSAVWLASEHDEVSEYGGPLAKYGFYFMASCTTYTFVKGIYEIKFRHNIESHRIWIIRCCGSLWGSFWLFRLMLLITGPLLRSITKTGSILFNIWFSAPIGIGLTESLRRHYEKKNHGTTIRGSK